MKRPLFYGCGTALVTPMRSNGTIDYVEFEHLVERQIRRGADALIVCGTTGESATLTDAEHGELFRIAVGTAGKRVPVIAGTGSNDTAHAVRRSLLAAECGADGLLLVTPYYNKTNQEGLVRHFTAITAAAQLPAILYNVPSRTGMSIEPATAQRLAADPYVCGIKEASGNTAQAARIAALCGEELPLYSGNDNDTLALLALGGQGVISVASNLMPQAFHDLCAAWQCGDVREARQLQLWLLPLCDALFCDVNPLPVKYAMERLGWAAGTCRPPLYDLPDEKKHKINQVLQQYQLI